MRKMDASGNLLEFIRQPLYDSELITAALTELRFFVNPLGSGGKTKAYTNLETSAQLSVPKSHLIDGFRFVPTSDIADADQLTFLRDILWQDTYIEFTVGGLKSYLDVPTWYLPAGFGFAGFSELDASAAPAVSRQISNGHPVFGNYFSIKSHPILIPSQQTFKFTWRADAALAAVTTDTRVWVVLEGVNGRETM